MQRIASKLRDDGNSFGILLKRLMLARDTSLYKLAQRLADSDDQYPSWRTSLRRYLNGSWIPSPNTTSRLAEALYVPKPILFVAARHLDQILGRLIAACLESGPLSWRTAAFERLFALFPLTERNTPSTSFSDDPLMDSRLVKICSLARILETLGRENFMDEEDPVQRIWPYRAWALPAVVRQKNLISEERPTIIRNNAHPLLARKPFEFSDFVSNAMAATETGYDSLFRSERVKYHVLLADHSVSLADATSEALFEKFEPVNTRKLRPVCDVLRVFQNTSLSWAERCASATIQIHAWADRIDGDSKQEADRVRRLLYPFKFKRLNEAQYNSIVLSATQ
jgi:transcriptional regulator with XRE-family HTH domain